MTAINPDVGEALHPKACYIDTGGAWVCAHWCEIGKLILELKKCVRHLETWGGNPGARTLRDARAALLRWGVVP